MNKTLLALLVGTLFATSASAEDLLQLYREARQTDPGLASARATYQALQERIPQAQSALLPNVAVSGSATYTVPDSTAQSTIDGFPKATQVNSNIALNASVSASQPLYRRQNTVVLDQAKTQVAQGAYVLQSAGQDLAVRLAQAYFDVLLAQDTLVFVGAQKVLFRPWPEPAPKAAPRAEKKTTTRRKEPPSKPRKTTGRTARR